MHAKDARSYQLGAKKELFMLLKEPLKHSYLNLNASRKIPFAKRSRKCSRCFCGMYYINQFLNFAYMKMSPLLQLAWRCILFVKVMGRKPRPTRFIYNCLLRELIYFCSSILRIAHIIFNLSTSILAALFILGLQICATCLCKKPFSLCSDAYLRRTQR